MGKSVISSGIQASADELAVIISEMQQAVLAVEKNGKIVFANQKAARLSGYSIVQLQQMTVAELGNFLNNRAAEKIKLPPVKFEYVRKDGIKLWLELCSISSYWQGKPVSVFFLKDITDKKRREDWQKYKNELLKSFRTNTEINVNLQTACEIVQRAGLFKRIVITLHNEAREIINYGYTGLDREIVEKAVSSPAPSEELKARMLSEVFRLSNSYFIPVESDLGMHKLERYIAPEKNDVTAAKQSSWQEGDELFTPLFAESGEIEGYLSVDTPHNGKRPYLETISYLEDLADLLSRQIHEIRRANKLLLSLDNFRAMVDHSAVALGVYHNKRFVYVNEFFCTLFGYSSSAILGFNELKTAAMIDFNAKEKLQQRDLIKATTGKGKTIWLDCFRNKINYGRSTAEIIILIDRTAERKFEIDLIQKQNKVRALIEATDQAVVLLDKNLRILDMNEQLVKRFKASKSEMLGSKPEKYLPPSLVKSRKREIEQVRRTKTSLIVEDQRNGRYFKNTVYPIINEKNEVYQFAVFSRDVTKEKQLMQQLLTTEKLAALGKVAAGIAHQIRNPLGNVSLAAQLCLQQSNLPEEVTPLLEMIIDDIKNTDSIISNLLNFSKAKEFRLELRDVREIVDNACNFITPFCKNKNISLEKKYPPQLPSTPMDSRWLIEAFINILMNSVHAVEEGGKISVELIPEQNDKVVKIIFKDNGSGIAAENMKSVFEPFFSTKDSGSGLGMSIVHKIIDTHNGSIEIDSEEGNYTWITVSLPLEISTMTS